MLIQQQITLEMLPRCNLRNESEATGDGKSLDEENLEEINGELLDQEIADVKLDEQKKVEDLQRYKEPKEVPSDVPTVN